MNCANHTHPDATEFLRTIGDVLMSRGGAQRLEVSVGGEICRAGSARRSFLPRPARMNGREGEQGRGSPEGAQGGSETGCGQGAASRKGSAGARASLIGVESVVPELRSRLAALVDAYPGTTVRTAPKALWVSSRVKPVIGLEGGRLLSLILSEGLDRPVVRTWAWWDTGLWIGPRHTNYPDGSVCSFEPADGTWSGDDDLVPLWDLYSVWVARQLHLGLFGFWPGGQVLHTAHERLRDQAPQELCGGCRSFRPYSECHYRADLRVDPLQRVAQFVRRFGAEQNRPPKAVTAFAFGSRAEPPTLEEIGARFDQEDSISVSLR